MLKDVISGYQVYLVSGFDPPPFGRITIGFVGGGGGGGGGLGFDVVFPAI